MREIPFSSPIKLKEINDSVLSCLSNSKLSGGGPLNKACEDAISQSVGRPIRLVTSATHALEMMSLLANIKPGDEVICPSFTFVSTANAFALRGATLKFADNDRFGNLKLEEIERLRSPQTKAVITVDYAGNSVDYDKLVEICDQHRLLLFEDAAQSLGAKYRGRPLGTFGAAACYSFHETKNVGCGEGGAIVVNEPSWTERVDILREKGTDRSQFFLGLVDKYSWVDLGSSWVLSELNAAVLKPQLEMLSKITERRLALWHLYYSELKSALQRIDAEILESPSYNSPNGHIFGIVFKFSEMRNQFIKNMSELGISAPFHYSPLHQSKYARRLSTSIENLPEAERFANCLSRLPLFHNLNATDQEYVIDKVKIWLQNQ